MAPDPTTPAVVPAFSSPTRGLPPRVICNHCRKTGRDGRDQSPGGEEHQNALTARSWIQKFEIPILAQSRFFGRYGVSATHRTPTRGLAQRPEGGVVIIKVRRGYDAQPTTAARIDC